MKDVHRSARNTKDCAKPVTDPSAAIVSAWERGKQRLHRVEPPHHAVLRAEVERLLAAFGRTPSVSEARALAKLVYLEGAGRWAAGVLREVLAGKASVESAGAWRFVVVRKSPDRPPAGSSGGEASDLAERGVPREPEGGA